MKRLILTLGVVLSLSILVACGNSEAEYKAVYDKIEQHEELNANDYDLMLDYIDDMVDAASKVKTMKDLKKLEKKYEYGTTFISELQYANPSEEVLSTIKKKAKKVSKKYEQAQKDMMEKLKSDDYNFDDDDDDDDDED